MTMTPDAKKALANTIRALRARLLADLHDETERAYRLSVLARDAGLPARARRRRKRIEDWIAEQQRADASAGKKAKARSVEDYRRDVEKQAAATLINRLVVLRLMEAKPAYGSPLRALSVLTGGWNSSGYAQFRSVAPALVQADPSEGYAYLLQLIFEDLATELPGIFGPVGLAELVPIPTSTLRHVVEALDDPALHTCWTDDMTLGWVYQYWNDPEREVLDAKINSGGKIAPHEVASKTQMFTERYMVDWLLQNSLAPMWLAMCRSHGWTPDVEADGTLDRLEARRAEWRAKRACGEVALTELMPLDTDAERRWAYYVPQPITQAAIDHAPQSVRELKLIDPAVGSGHFLVAALDLLVPLYHEEARHRGEADKEQWSEAAIVERILSHNLHGIDLDPRAVQIAAAALWLKARRLAPTARPRQLNLVAANLRLASLPDDDPALEELRAAVARDTGIPGELTDTIVSALRGADHLGSLLRVDGAVDAALRQHVDALGRAEQEQGGLFHGFKSKTERTPITPEAAKGALLGRIQGFLEKHTGSEDLGLRLRGEQLAAGVRFVRMVQAGTYDLVVANPPYLGGGRMADASYIGKNYPAGKADLYAAFLLRGLELVRKGGVSAMLTMRGWMFVKQFAKLRRALLNEHGLWALGDFDRGAFEGVADELLSVVVSVFSRGSDMVGPVALCPTDRDDRARDGERTHRKRAATLCHEGRHTFDPAALRAVPQWPLVYWWDAAMLEGYRSAPLIGRVAPASFGATTGDNTRFVRRAWEVPSCFVDHAPSQVWVPFVNGAKGRAWMEEAREAMHWGTFGLAYQVFCTISTGANFRSPHLQFRRGVAFSMIGANFSARVYRYPSVFGNKGSSVFPDDLAGAVCAMNSTRARNILASLNPGIGFEVGDVNRLPLFPIQGADQIFAQVESAFDIHEAHREPSVEFKRPGPSPWRRAQEWAQEAVDRPEGAPLPAYAEQLDPEPPTDHLSFALGVALGRFGPSESEQEGILDPAVADLSHALPHGILFLDTTLDETDHRDGLGHAAAAPLHAAWAEHGPHIDTSRGLRGWLALDFFGLHRSKAMYDGRPIHWPLSSAKKTFVAWVNIHRFTEQTLRVLLADHLLPTLARIDGELADLRAARAGADKRAARAAERRYDSAVKHREELATFIADVETCADHGPPPTDARCPPREQDARYVPDLDDGVMINSAALWPLLQPQWADPKKWFYELATAEGRKDYDWAHLAMRYWPTRVDAKCRVDPSLGVAHGCFWRYHPARAWAWELRLQDEIDPDFRITEAPYRPGGRDLDDGGDEPHRAAFLRDEFVLAIAAIEKEAKRRMGRGSDKRVVRELRLLEPGLWTAHPDALWELEMALAERQGAEFRILAPDEPAARAAFLAANPKRLSEWRQLVADFAPRPDREGVEHGTVDGDDVADDGDDGDDGEHGGVA